MLQYFMDKLDLRAYEFVLYNWVSNNKKKFVFYLPRQYHGIDEYEHAIWICPKFYKFLTLHKGLSLDTCFSDRSIYLVGTGPALLEFKLSF